MGERRDRRLILPYAMFITPCVIVPVVAFLTRDEPEFGSIVAPLATAALVFPVFLVGFVWLLSALYRRRPLRKDVVGWLCWVPLFAISLAMACYGLVVFKGFMKDLPYSYGETEPYLVASSVIAHLGLGGLVFTVASLVPRRSSDRTSSSGQDGAEAPCDTRES
ncbi:MAG: hypothetical protein WC971_00380 [Coriobacteriia bacterium]